MKSSVVIDAGICGLQTCIHADSDDEQNVTFQITSDCKNIQKFSEALAAKGPVDGYGELGAGADGVILGTAREHLKGCCSACIVPSGVFKAMQVAAGMALPKDATLQIKSE